MNNLSQRQNTILKSVIEAHIETAQPVGSRAVIDREKLSASPATVRSEMGYLGEMGYLSQVHISSGRIPTDAGYRYYINRLLQVPQKADGDGSMADRLYDLSQSLREADRFVEAATEFLSNLTRQASVTCIINPHHSLVRYERLGLRNTRVYFQGASCILEQPEFQDISKVKPLLKAFDEKSEIIRYLGDELESDQVTVKIGHENDSAAFHECSVVAKRYYVGGENAGTVAIVGPKRLPYAYAMPVVSRMAEMVGAILGNYY